MKKLLSISILLSATFLISCKKDWTCTCQGQVNGEEFTFEKSIDDVTKESAAIECDDDDFNVDSSNFSDCSL